MKNSLLRFLVYTGILGIVIAILFTALSQMPPYIYDNKTDAESQCMQMAVAIKAFHNEYQVWPADFADLQRSGSNNKRQIMFYKGTLSNFWEKPLKYAVDLNEDGKIDASDCNLHTASKVIHGTAAVLSDAF